MSPVCTCRLSVICSACCDKTAEATGPCAVPHGFCVLNVTTKFERDPIEQNLWHSKFHRRLKVKRSFRDHTYLVTMKVAMLLRIPPEAK